MDSTEATEAAEPQVVFRPGKKRKMYRQRPVDTGPGSDATGDVTRSATGGAATTEAQSSVSVDDTDEKAEEQGLSVAEVLRLRNARKSRPRGVEFRSDDALRSVPSGPMPEQSLVLREAAVEAAVGMGKRFAPQTGMVYELVNKHM